MAEGMTRTGLLHGPARLACCIAVFLLAGCWTGTPWFTPSGTATPLPDGRYRMLSAETPSAQGDVLSVTRQPDGALALDGADKPLRAVIVPLDPAGASHRHIVQLQQAGHTTHALYLLLDDGDGRYRLALLPCGDRWAEAAERSGGSIIRDPQAAATCDFGNRDALVAALGAASRTATFDLELVPEAR
jgi:hypothetical protein